MRGVWIERLEGVVEVWRMVVRGRAEVRVVRRGKRRWFVGRCMVIEMVKEMAKL